jgi:hypothetical protein
MLPILLAILAGLTQPALAQSDTLSGLGVGRPVILIVHGRGQLGRDTASLRREWQRTLEAGLRLPTMDSLFHDGDVRLVWYADVLDPRSDEGCRFHSANPRSRERWERRGGAQAFWDLARGVIGVAAERLDAAGADETRGLLGDLLFAADLWKRCGAERRLADALDDAAREHRPVVLVSHSFGALVSYGFLHGYEPESTQPRASVRRWVTVGSMLGVPAVRQLLLGDMGTSLPRPPIVERWLNVHDADDLLSARLDNDSTISDAVELQTETSGGALAHEITTYLRDERTAHAITFAWCSAFAGAHTAPGWCERVKDPR